MVCVLLGGVRFAAAQGNGDLQKQAHGLLTQLWVVTGEKKDARPNVADPSHPFAHPFYWSPFVLIGHWR